VTVPRLVHLAWFADGPLPKDVERARAGWAKRHPGWVVRVWRPTDLPTDLVRREALDPLRSPLERWQIARPEILYQHGGLAVDTRLQCVGPADTLFEGASFLVLRRDDGRLDDAVVAAAAGHPLLQEVIRHLRPREYWGLDLSGTGDAMLAELVTGREDVSFVPTQRIFGSPNPIAVDRRPLGFDQARALALDTEGTVDALTRELEAERAAAATARRELMHIRDEVSAAPVMARLRTMHRAVLPPRPPS